MYAIGNLPAYQPARLPNGHLKELLLFQSTTFTKATDGYRIYFISETSIPQNVLGTYSVVIHSANVK